MGVEGMSLEIIEQALERSGVIGKKVPNKRKITKNDMYLAGLSGRENSSIARKKLLKRLSLPESLSSSAMLDILNTFFTYEEFIEVTKNGEEI